MRAEEAYRITKDYVSEEEVYLILEEIFKEVRRLAEEDYTFMDIELKPSNKKDRLYKLRDRKYYNRVTHELIQLGYKLKIMPEYGIIRISWDMSKNMNKAEEEEVEEDRKTEYNIKLKK